MLRERLVRFINEPAVRRLTHHDQRQVARAVLLYGLGRRNSEQLRQLGLRYDITEPLYCFKSEVLDRTYYMVSLFWRVCFEYFRRYQAPTAAGPTVRYLDVPTLKAAVQAVKTIESDRVRAECQADAQLLEAFLTVEDQREIYRVARATSYATPADPDLVPIVSELRRYCAGLVRRRMRFIIKHDIGLTAEDLQNALFEAGLMTLRHYDSEPNELKLLNTAKRGSHNYFVRLLEYYTARCRSRLVRHQEGRTVPYGKRACGTCAWFDVVAPDGRSCETAGSRPSHRPCRRKAIGNFYQDRTVSAAHVCGNCLYYDRDGPLYRDGCVEHDVVPTCRPCRSFELRVGSEQFIATTASLDAPVVSRVDEVGTARLMDFIPAPAPAPAENEWLDRLLATLPELQARVVSITLGRDDPAFDDWLWRRTSRFAHDFNDGQLARYACEFLGVELDDMRAVLREHLPVRRRQAR